MYNSNRFELIPSQISASPSRSAHQPVAEIVPDSQPLNRFYSFNLRLRFRSLQHFSTRRFRFRMLSQPDGGFTRRGTEVHVAARRPQFLMSCKFLDRLARCTTLPKGVLFLRLENFSTTKAALDVATSASAVVEWAGKIWLLTLGPKGVRSSGGTLVAEIGPVPDVPPATSYVLDVNEANFDPEMKAQVAQQVHTHPGPEIFYLLTGEQYLSDARRGFAPDVSGSESNDNRLCASAVGRAQRDLRRARDTAAGDRHGKHNARATSGDGDRRWKYQRVALGPNGLQRNDRIRRCDRAERHRPRRGFIAVEDHSACSRWSDDGQRLQHGFRRARRSAVSARCGKNTRRNRRSAEKVRCSPQHQPHVVLLNRSSRPVTLPRGYIREHRPSTVAHATTTVGGRRSRSRNAATPTAFSFLRIEREPTRAARLEAGRAALPVQ